MSDIKSEFAGLICFTNLLPQVPTVEFLPTTTECQQVALLPACQITLLKDSKQPNGSLPVAIGFEIGLGTTTQPAWRWDPCFWKNERAVESALSLLLVGIGDPIIWVLGEYEISEVGELKRQGLIPHNVKYGPPSAKTSHLPIIVRLDKSSDLLIPAQQGFGHFPGVRIAIFNRGEEPLDLYEYWLSSAIDQGITWAFTNFIDSDCYAPVGAIAWMAPFGEENREHATLAKAGISPPYLAEQLANHLNLPLLISNCSEKEFRQWEWDYTLPDDLRLELEG